MLKVFTKKRFWKNLCTVLLCLVLCFTLVVNTCVDSFAIAGVDDGLFFLLLAILTASGITFSSVANAHIGTDAFYNNCSPNLQKWLDSKAMEITAFAAGVSSIAVTCTKYWSDVIDAIAKTFGDYTGIDAHISISSPGVLKKNESLSYSVPGVTLSNAVNVSLGNMSVDFIGGQCTSKLLPDYISDVTGKDSFRIYTVGNTAIGLTFVYDCGSFAGHGSNEAITFNDSITYTNGRLYSTYLELGNMGWPWSAFFQGQQIYKDYIDNTCRSFKLKYSSSGADVIVNGKLGDYTFGESVCPDGVWTNKTWYDWINELIFGDGAGASDIPSVGALPGNPSIDVGAMPGNDVWHDGIDDVATGSPSIGVSVPTDVSDETITDYTRDVARDIASADKVLDDTSTEDKPGDKDKDKTGTTPNIPAVSLPEILFKEKFPFCLPWDLYNLFAVLAAEPEAPKFVIPYKNNMLGIDEEYVLDFSKYEDAAKIIRFFTGAGFVLALILISRKLTGSE